MKIAAIAVEAHLEVVAAAIAPITGMQRLMRICNKVDKKTKCIDALGIGLVTGALTDKERAWTTQLMAEKYQHDSWTMRV